MFDHFLEWTDDTLVAQALVFFIAGFDTTSTMECFTAHELAVNPNIQKRLQEEVDQVANKNNGKVTYNDINAMKYLDMVISGICKICQLNIYKLQDCS